jgi:endoglucanase
VFLCVNWQSNIFVLLLLNILVWGCAQEPSPVRLERVLHASWQSYVRHYISPEGRVVIPERGGETISEAQAYALLRAVWANDPDTFVRVYAWTHQHLSRHKTHGDHLLAWRWGKSNSSYGILDANTATDGDLDYALTLTLAARRGWPAPPNLPPFLEEARRVQAAILEHEVVTLPTGELLLTPGNWHEDRPPYLVNPSYFSPGAYRLFHEMFRLNPQHLSLSPNSPSPLRGEGRGGGAKSCIRLHQSTYPLLGRLQIFSTGNRKPETENGILFPDWCRVDAQGRPSPAPGKSTDFGWEAVRLPWRLALDALWFKDENAARLLAQNFLPFFKREWQARGKLFAVYGYDGTPRVDYESPVMYAGVLAAALAAGDRDLARQMAEKILSFYRENDGQAYFEAPDNYYAQNWAWLGLATYAGLVKSF